MVSSTGSSSRFFVPFTSRRELDDSVLVVVLLSFPGSDFKVVFVFNVALTVVVVRFLSREAKVQNRTSLGRFIDSGDSFDLIDVALC